MWKLQLCGKNTSPRLTMKSFPPFLRRFGLALPKINLDFEYWGIKKPEN
jgi:hypothetical protein